MKRVILARSCQRGNVQISTLSRRAPCTLKALAMKKGQAGIASHAHNVDVVALGNLCVDIVVPMDVLPPKDFEHRRRWVSLVH